MELRLAVKIFLQGKFEQLKYHKKAPAVEKPEVYYELSLYKKSVFCSFFMTLGYRTGSGPPYCQDSVPPYHCRRSTCYA